MRTRLALALLVSTLAFADGPTGGGGGGGGAALPAPGTSGNVLTSNGSAWTSAAASGGGPTRAATDSHDTIVWTLDEASGTYANSGNGGTLALTPTTGTSGYYTQGNTALFASGFLATNTRLESPATSIGESNTITVSCWFRAPNTLAAMADLVTKKYQEAYSGPTGSIELLIDNTGLIYGVIADATNTAQYIVPPVYARVAIGSINHAGVTYDGTTANVYLNGSLVASAAVTGPIAYNTHRMWTVDGYNFSGTAGGYLTGWIDDIRVANTARPASWFLSVWQSGTGLGK